MKLKLWVKNQSLNNKIEIETISHCLKIVQIVSFEFHNLAFSTNFCPFKRLTCLVTLFDIELQILVKINRIIK